MGYMHLQKQDRLFHGTHQPVVSKELFFQVQAKLTARVWPRTLRHRFKYSRMFKCATCGRSLVGSEKKGRVYYRCHTATCPTTSFREDVLDTWMNSQFNSIALRPGIIFASGKALTMVPPDSKA